MPESTFRVRRIDHVELFVPERHAAAEWYRDVLGFEILTDFEFWAEDERGPLMLSCDGGRSKLALFRGKPLGDRETAGFRRVAFEVDGDGFLEFLGRLAEHQVAGHSGRPLTPADAVDHERAFSIYFMDPWGHPYEITTYDHAQVNERL